MSGFVPRLFVHLVPRLLQVRLRGKEDDVIPKDRLN